MKIRQSNAEKFGTRKIHKNTESEPKNAIQPKLQSSEFTFAPIFWPNFAVSELKKKLGSSDSMDELCNYKLQSLDIRDELGSIFLCAETAKFGHSGRTFQFTTAKFVLL